VRVSNAAYKILVVKSERMKQLGDSGHKLEDNIAMDLQE
jgi:hypothetical protein